MRRLTSLLSLCLLFVLLSACQEEDHAPITIPVYNPTINLPDLSPKFPSSLPGDATSGQAISLNDHVSYRLPRLPRPLPCPVLAGCQLPIPQLLMSVSNGHIDELIAELYTSNGELYASSSEEYGGQTSYEGENAMVSLAVLNDQAESEQLILRVQIAYEVNEESFVEELVDENTPVNLDAYSKHGLVLFRFPFPRPLPCIEEGNGELFKCQVPSLELHTVVLDGSILNMQAALYDIEGNLYAISDKDFGGQVVYQGQEALSTLVVVNQEIVPENLILALQITHGIGEETISEEIYEEGISFLE